MLKLLVAFKEGNVLLVACVHFQEENMIDVCGSQRLLDMLEVSVCDMLQ